jgi:hemerythrin
MAIITWDERIETRHGEIDAQHKALIQAFNDLHDAMKQGRGKEEVGRTLNFLADYTQTHFRMEESLMTHSGYPRAAKHRELHAEFEGKALALVNDFEKGRTLITLPVMDFIEDWLVNHIQGEDVLLAQFLNGKA